ncbi:MAG: filamentous hemagglutinin N-terminal domain-containing protein [Xenococcaceae cyanobacterium MO_207.B15]|nr:filamentous hemagglutinin N-terminal domain-containing protein [Xenococcaceae cyanobacterium MO_207.B15]
MNKALLPWFSLACFSFASFSAQAQISTDGTTSTTISPTETGVQIDNGSRAEGNLFHSFREFSVPTGSEAFFNNANDIVNIFSRVTGGNISNIDGLIRANGGANLFLINPAGILFGENARLNVGGSFYGSTADSILFPNGIEFSAVNPQTPILTINAPIGLNLRDNPAEITVRGNGNGARLTDSPVIDTQEALRVKEDATLGLVGGNLIFEGATIKTAGGRIELGSVAGGDVAIIPIGNNFTFDYSAIQTFSDISLFNSSNIDASGNGGGDIQVVGRNITLNGIAAIEANTLGGEAGGDINIFASESLEINGIVNDAGLASGIFNTVFPNATADGGNINIETENLSLGENSFIATFVLGQGDAGNIDITTGSLSLNNGASLSAGTFGSGNAGNVNINATDSVLIDGVFSNIATNVDPNAIGDGGDINITTNSFSLTNGSLLFTSTFGSGNAGNVNINATNTVTIDNSSSIFTNVFTNAIGNGGDINITTTSFSLTNGAFLSADTSGQGNAGNVNINATATVSLDNFGSILTNVDTNAVGDGGNINITTTALSLSNGAFLSSNTLGQGNAGNINLNTGSLNLNNSSLIDSSSTNSSAGNVTINANDAVSLTNSSIIFVPGADGGSITIEGKSLEITSGSALVAGINVDSGSAEAQAGDIIINLTEDLLIDGTGSDGLTNISNQNLGTGNAGNVAITARNIDFRNGGNIFNFNTGAGNLGDITIVARGDISLDGIKGISESGIFNLVALEATGDVGEINIQAQNLSLTNGGRIESLVAGMANSGDINLNVADTITVDGSGEAIDDDGTTTLISSQIASAVSSLGDGSFGIGNSGDININTQNLSLSRNAQVSASIFGIGNAGDININADVITIGEQGDITISPSTISSEAISGILALPLLEANGGDITINTRSLSISDGGNIDTGIRAIGNGGNITINAIESISVDGTGILQNPLDQTNIELRSAIRASTSDTAIGNGGSIEINTGNFSLTNQGLISTSSVGQGDAGNITINATDSFVATNDSLITSNIGSPIETPAIGRVGNITISSRDISLSDTSQIQAGAFGNATATQPGIISLTATEKISFTGTNTEILNTGIFSNNDPDSFGDASNISLSAPNIVLNDDAVITARNAGNGQGGDIIIEADILTLNASSITTSNEGQGDAGNINVNATNSFLAKNNSIISSNIGNMRDEPTARGRVGNITISSRDISLSDTSQIQAGAFPNATATQQGIVSLTATEQISFTGTRTGIFSNNDPGSFGDASNVSLSAPNIALSNDAVITASNEANGQGGDITIEGDILTLDNSAIRTNTSGKGNAGEIDINLTNSLELRESSSIRAAVAEDATGLGGNVDIKTAQVTVNEGSEISTSTNGDGNAGELTINATDSIELEGSTAEGRSGFFASATEGSGDGGDITVITDELNIRNGATISVSNFQSLGLASPGTGEAGNLTIKANSITLDNNATIDAATRSGEGGIITLQVAEDIRLQNNSLISAQANEDADGGNVNINSRFILAFPSSGNGNDIIADAQQGMGGNINITAEALLGIEERTAIPGNGTNDIDASSQFGLDGNVTFNVPDTKSFQETAELSSNVVSAEAVAQNACSPGAGESGLVLLGKGGVPPAPNLPLSAAVLLDNGKPITPNFSQLNNQQTTQNITPQIQPVKTSQGDIYPARGVVVREDGTVILTAYPTSNNPTRTPTDVPSCD